MNKGFQVMVPLKGEDQETKEDFKYEMKFSLFKKEFLLQFKVKPKQEN